jgi:hypothetical protein
VEELTKLKVMLVDDHAMVRRGLRFETLDLLPSAVRP